MLTVYGKYYFLCVHSKIKDRKSSIIQSGSVSVTTAPKYISILKITAENKKHNAVTLVIFKHYKQTIRLVHN